MRRLLGDVTIEFDEMITDQFGLDFPWPITITDVGHSTIHGSEYVTITIDFDPVVNASSYQVRVSLLPEVKVFQDYLVGSTETFTTPSNVFYLPKPVIANSISLVTVRSGSASPSGGWATWTKIFAGGPGGIGDGPDVWLGTGVGTGTSVFFDDNAALYGAYGVMAVYGNVATATVSDIHGSASLSPATTLSTPTSTVTSPGDIIYNAIYCRYGFLTGVFPDGTWADTGFAGQYITANRGPAITSNGAAISTAISLGSGSFSTTFGVNTGGGGAGACQTVSIALAVTTP